MVLSVGAEPVLLAVTPRQKPRLQSIVDRWSIDAILAALQILAEARSRMRGVSHTRLLAELALVRVARLENLSDLSNMVQRLTAIESGSPVSHKTEAHGTKKKLTSLDPQSTEAMAAAEPPRVLRGAPARSGTREQAVDPAPAIADLAEGTRVEAAIKPGPAMESSLESRVVTSSSAQAGSPAKVIPASRPPAEGVPAAHEAGPGAELPALEPAAIRQLWPELVKKVGSPLSMRLAVTEAISVEEPDVLVIAAKPGYNSLADFCGTDEAREKIAHCLQRLLRRPVTVRYRSLAGTGAGQRSRAVLGTTPARDPGGRPDGSKSRRTVRGTSSAPGIRRRPEFALIGDFEWKEILGPARSDPARGGRDDGFPTLFLCNKEGSTCSVNWETWPN